MVMDYCPGGDVGCLLNRKKVLKEKQEKKIQKYMVRKTSKLAEHFNEKKSLFTQHLLATHSIFDRCRPFHCLH